MKSFGDLDIHLTVPDLWQQEAISLLKAGRDVVVHAPTGAGKTYLVELIGKSNRRGQIVLAVPTRALANDKAREFKEKGWRVGIVTGDVTIDTEAPLVIATLETQKPRLLQGKGPSLFVVDEYQMIGDAARGVNYELSIAMAPEETQLLLLSGSVSNPEDVVDWLRRLGRNAELVSLQKRPVPQEEIHLDALSQRPPKSVTGFWPRMIAKGLMADLGPILIFAPQRKAAEKLARQLAAALPVENALALGPAQKALAGSNLEKMLANRVAFHHSGLSYQQRAGLIEPLAKAGQLRIVVATTGLAAGVNFSMRSVLVTESRFMVGQMQQMIGPDELLQMFGRAGRRGLDTVGYALCVPDRPRLREARAKPIRRPKLIDWPSLIALMAVASQRGENPFEYAVLASKRLFNSEPVPIGVEDSLANPRMPCGLEIDALRARHSQPESIEILNAKGQWEPAGEIKRVRLETVLVRSGQTVNPFLSDVQAVRSLQLGKLTRIRDASDQKQFGIRSVLGFRDRKREDVVSLAGWLFAKLREQLGLTGRRITLSELGGMKLGEILGLGSLCAYDWKGEKLVGQFDLRTKEVECFVDTGGNPIWQAETRKAYPRDCLTCSLHTHCEADLSPRRSPAFAWRQLDLIDDQGVPSLRGKVFSLFQGGEGLAVAAALEEPGYSVDQIAHDLANLRAGYRFEEYANYSSRLARACRLAYGDKSYEGYLRHGLPPQYGDGAAEVIAEWMHHAGKGKRFLGEDLRFGDLQRAKLEWLSLLRHIAQAPELDWERWQELQKAARAILETDDQRMWQDDLPPLEPSQQSRISHFLRFPRKF